MKIRSVPEKGASNSAAKLCDFIYLHQTLRFYSFAFSKIVVSMKKFYVKVDKNQEAARQSVY